MGEVKISVSERLDSILQKLADNLGIKKAELVKGFVVKDLFVIKNILALDKTIDIKK